MFLGYIVAGTGIRVDPKSMPSNLGRCPSTHMMFAALSASLPSTDDLFETSPLSQLLSRNSRKKAHSYGHRRRKKLLTALRIVSAAHPCWPFRILTNCLRSNVTQVASVLEQSCHKKNALMPFLVKSWVALNWTTPITIENSMLLSAPWITGPTTCGQNRSSFTRTMKP